MEGKFKVFIIAAIVVLAIATAGSAFLAFHVLNSTKQLAANSTSVESVGTDGQVDLSHLTEVSLGDSILTNISVESDNIQHFAKVQVSLNVISSDEKAYAALAASIESHSASIRSTLIEVVGQQTYSMLTAADGKEKLGDEIVAKLSEVLGTDLIYEACFQEYFVQ